MSSRVSAFVAGLAVLILGLAGCARESSAFTLEIDALRQLSPESTAGITYEERRGTMYVTVIDKHGDGHVHRLILGDVTRAQALELLGQKQAELGRRE
ncbi:MAG TPA: hypothetical protein VM095_00310 [Pyrinomonadaceae bacterium]|nr:hypothetical protein [Pyrinomonadaceae bacterium]